MISLPRRKRSPTKRPTHNAYPMGWVLFCVMAASVMCGVVWHGRAFVMTGTLLLVVVVGLILPHLSLRKISARLIPLQPRGQVGKPSPLRVELTNTNPWPWGTTVTQLSERSSVAHPEGKLHPVMISRIPRHGTSSTVVELEPTARGLFPEETGTLLTRFPFGLKTSQSTFSIPRRMIVWPELVSIWKRSSDSRFAGYDRSTASQQRFGDEGDIAGPRPYRPGESLRRVHWRHTARRGELIVCERESRSSRRLRVRLELQAAKDTSAEREAYEAAITIAASLVSDAVASGWHVDLELPGYPAWDGIDGVGLNAVLDFLATFDAQGLREEGSASETKRRDSIRSVLITQRDFDASTSLALFDEVITTSVNQPPTAIRCDWFPPGSPWREQIAQTGERIHG
ncbi:DUF58 domain-containing protein [Bremerella sp. JC817]|uniref:DUF58 domain-containing protein n=1 Tax=Bremerella sp. JC817 TaxID=3231756 RepID=UPI003459C921